MTPTGTSWMRFLVPAAAVCAALAATGPAPADLPPNFNVDTTADLPDGKLNDGLCLTSTGSCSLRAAVQQANALGSGNINLRADTVYKLTRIGANEDQAATGDLDLGVGPLVGITIRVPGGGRATVQGGSGWDDRIFEIHANAYVTLNALEIRGGHAVLQDQGGGGILNSGALAVTRSTITLNTSLEEGGGIENRYASLTMTNSTVSGNTSPLSGGGIYSEFSSTSVTNSTVNGNSAVGAGGGIASIATYATVTNSTVSGNAAGVRGGGIAIYDGLLSVTNSTVSGNAAGDGGGIYTTSGLTLTGSTVSQNSAQGRGERLGGGVYVAAYPGSLTAENSTISTNAATSDGGGIYNVGATYLNNVTVADNVADSDGSGSGDGGGIANARVGFAVGRVSVHDTIVGDNIDASGTMKYPDCVGDLVSGGFNLVENTSGCAISEETVGNITGRDPRLGPLQDNGGLTFTHALLLGDAKFAPSPAIDNGNPYRTPGQPWQTWLDCPLDSQNGLSRPMDGNGDGDARCDIGAYELPRQRFTLTTSGPS